MKFRIQSAGRLPALLAFAAPVFLSSLCYGQNCTMLLQSKKTDVTCYGAANGTATVMLSGGTPPFVYSGGLSLRTSNAVSVFNNLSPGAYQFTVTDGTGCRVNNAVDITEPPALQVSGLPIIARNNLSNGSISVTVSGGGPPYAYVWNTGAQTQHLSGLGGGTYALTVTDANGCSVMLMEVLPSFLAEVAKPSPAGEAVLYPNPSNGLVHVKISSEERDKAMVKLVDMSGRMIKTIMVDLEKGINTKDLQLPVQSGIYLLQIRTSRETRTMPVRVY